MNSLKLIKVGNGSNKYPGNFTKKEIQLIQGNIRGSSLHLFSGMSNIGDVRIDYKCNTATINGDVFEYLKNNTKIFKTIILDPPYNLKFADTYQKLNNTPEQFIIFANPKKTTELFELILKNKPKRIIIKSWNYYVPKGYRDIGSYICYAGGYRKPTILMIIERIKNE